MRPLIGISGYAGAGKDTAAEPLLEHGYQLMKFAAPLKALSSRLNPWIRTLGIVGTSKLPMTYQFRRLNDIIAEVGPEAAKDFEEVRRFYQDVGQDVRDLDRDFWVRVLENQLVRAEFDEDEGGMFYRCVMSPTVITDVRYPNEAAMIKKLGGILLWIDRPGVGPCNDHASESGVCRELADIILDNSGDVAELHRAVLQAVA